MLLLDVLIDVACDTLAGERLFAALRRHFMEEKRTTSLDVRPALERRRRREGYRSELQRKQRQPQKPQHRTTL
jgi:hypothetical protein